MARTRTRVRKLTLQARAEIVRDFLAGESIGSLADRHRVSRQRVGQVLDAGGVPPRPRYPALLMPEEEERMQRLWLDGATVLSIAKDTGRAASSVSTVLARAGMRAPWQRRHRAAGRQLDQRAG